MCLTSAVAGGEWSASRPGRFNPTERSPGTCWIRGWVDPRASLDVLEERKFFTLPGLELRHLRRPARSQSLYRLRYPGSKGLRLNGNNIAVGYLPNAPLWRQHRCGGQVQSSINVYNFKTTETRGVKFLSLCELKPAGSCNIWSQENYRRDTVFWRLSGWQPPSVL
jgi:hypothetical protein